MQKITDILLAQSQKSIAPRAVQVVVDLDGQQMALSVLRATLTAAVGGSPAFSVGNAIPSTLELVCAGTTAINTGTGIVAKWMARDWDGATENPLFVGTVDTCTISSGTVTITARDALYSAGGTLYSPAERCLRACSARDVLEDIGAKIGVSVDAETLTTAQDVALTDGVGALGYDCTISQALGAIAAVMGGNAMITRSGTLAVKTAEVTDWQAEAMAGADEPQSEAYAVSGIKFLRKRTASSDDPIPVDVVEEHTAGAPVNLTIENAISTDELANAALRQLRLVPAFFQARYTIAGGLLLEPGDVFDVLTASGTYKTYAGQVTQAIDGGCTTSVECWGAVSDGGTVSPTTQAIRAIEADVANFKRLTADYAKIAKADVDDLYATRATVSELTVTAQNLQDQIDGSIQTFSGTTAPTLTNYPTSTWGNDLDSHVGDLFTGDKGSAIEGFWYRFQAKQGGGYEWVHLRDNDIQKALSDAQAAQSAADKANTSVSELKVNVDGIATRVGTAEGNISTLTQTATSLTTRLSSVETQSATAASDASSAKTAVNSSIKSTTMHYLATSASSGVTTSTAGWTTTIQNVTATNKYLWTYQTITTVGGTSSNTSPVITGVYGDKGATGAKGDTGATGSTGAKGDTGVGISEVVPLYRTSNSTTAPAAPTAAVTSTSTGANTWTKALPAWNATYPYYYTTSQVKYTDNTYKWSTVVRDSAIEDACKNAADAKSASTTTTTKLNEVVSDLNGTKQTVSNLTTTVNNKADGSTVTALSNRVTTVETTASGLSARVSATETVANNAYSTVANDPTNYSNLSDLTTSRWGFSADSTADGHWYTMLNMSRDKFVSDYIECKGKKKLRIQFQISTSCQADRNNTGTANIGYVGTAIGIYMFKANYVSAGIVYSSRTTGSASAPVTTVDSIVETVEATSKFRVFVQTEAFRSFSGFIKIRNLRVSAVDALDSRISTAESEITQNANEIALRVRKDGVISSINQTAESVKIQAGKINLVGAVTADTIASNAVTSAKINAGAITAEKIASNAVTADKINAGAVTTAKLSAGAVTADKISADAAFANKVFANDITATGTITGVTLKGATGTFSKSVGISNGQYTATLDFGSYSGSGLPPSWSYSSSTVNSSSLGLAAMFDAAYIHDNTGYSTTMVDRLQVNNDLMVSQNIRGKTNSYLGIGTVYASSIYANYIYGNYCNVDSGNTTNYPWHRIATVNAGTGQYVDKDALLRIRKRCNGGWEGVIKITLRTNLTGSACDVGARWMYRYGIPRDSVKIALWGNTGNDVYADVYMNVQSGWSRCIIEEISGYRHFKLIDSYEVDNTTTSDKKTSYEVYTSVEDGASKIRGKAYTATFTSVDAGEVNISAVAKALYTPRTLTIGNTGKSFDGSGNVSWSLSEIGAAASSHSHSYLPLSGGTLTGNVNVEKGAATEPKFLAKDTGSGVSVWLGVGSSGTNHGVYSAKHNKWIAYADANGSCYLSGNAATATKLATARTISLTGSVTGSGSFDGSGNLSISTVVKDVNGSSSTTFAYSKAGMGYGDYTWLAGWNGYELRAVNKSQFAQASHTHAYVPTSYITSGKTTVTPDAANTVKSVNVSFGKTLSASPAVTATAHTSDPSVCSVSVGNISTTGFTLYFKRNSTSATTVSWIAVC